MKMTYLMTALLLAPCFATQATAHVRASNSSDRPHLGTRSIFTSPLLRYEIEGREILAPPWSFACMNDAGPRECGQHVWFYGSEDALARYTKGY
jgi:hypothetical protein